MSAMPCRHASEAYCMRSIKVPNGFTQWGSNTLKISNQKTTLGLKGVRQNLHQRESPIYHTPNHIPMVTHPNEEGDPL